MLRGRVGGRIGERDNSQPNINEANGLWGLQEAYDALRRASWPLSRQQGFNLRRVGNENASCSRLAILESEGRRSEEWGDPISFEWQRSAFNSNTPSTGNPWLSEYFLYNGQAYFNAGQSTGWSQDSLNQKAMYAAGLSPSPLVRLLSISVETTDPLFSQVTLLADFNYGCLDKSPASRSFFVRRDGSLSSVQVRNGSRSFTDGAISYYGEATLPGDFTIEGWFWFTSSDTDRTFFSIGTDASGGSHMFLSIRDGHVFFQSTQMTGSVINTDEWVHIAATRAGSTVKLFVNGFETGSTTYAGTAGDNLLAGNLMLHAASGEYVDEFRITKSARYTSNFTLGEGPFEAGGIYPVVEVSGAGSVIANGIYSPGVSAISDLNSKQVFFNHIPYERDSCIFWEPTRGFWVICDQSPPPGTQQNGYGGSFLYVSDGNYWKPISQSYPTYAPEEQQIALQNLGFQDNETSYRITTKSGFNENESFAAQVTVEPIVIEFTEQPSDQFAENGSASFQADAKAFGQFSNEPYAGTTYQWQKRPAGSNAEFTNVIGQTEKTLQVSGVAYGANGDNGEQYRLIAISCDGQSVKPSKIAILYVGAPYPPQSLLAEPGDGSASLAWGLPASPGDFPIVDYIVQYSVDSGVTWTTFSDGTSTSRTANVTGLTNGVAYIFRVAAVNAGAGNGVLVGPFCSPSARIIPSPVDRDPYYPSVSFVSNFEGANNATLFYDDSLAFRLVSPFGNAKTSTSQSKWGSAAYFDGIGDYLRVTETNAFRMGSQDFTIEAWVYPEASSGTRAIVATSGASVGYGFWLGTNGGGFYFRLGNSSGWVVERQAGSYSVDGWNHVALTRSGRTLRLYINGQQVFSEINSLNIANTNSELRIGGESSFSSGQFQGYIGGLRITKGVDRYPSGLSFTPPTVKFPVAAINAALPGTPTLVVASGGTRQVSLSWASPSANGSAIRDYLVEYSGNGGETWTSFSDGSSGNTTATVTGLANDTPYIFRVAAVNHIGTGQFSEATSPAWTNALPGAPTGVTGTGGNGEVSASWTSPASNGGASITDYVVQFSSNGGSTWNTFSDGTSANTSATVTGLTNGTSYVFRVAAVTNVGTGSYSVASGAVSPAATAPGAPTSVSGILGNQQVSLIWTPPASNGGSAITDYVVQSSADGGANWTTFSDGTSTAAAATVTGLTNDTSYIFRVAAVNAVAQGQYSSASGSVTPGLGDPYWSNVVLLLNMNGTVGSSTLTDSSSQRLVPTMLGGAISATGKFGNGVFLGEGIERIVVPNTSAVTSATNLFTFGTGDFAIEFFIRLAGIGGWVPWIFNTAFNADGLGNGIQIRVSPAGALSWSFGDGSNGFDRTTVNGVVTTDTWHYIAASRTGGTARLYVDGALVDSVADTTNIGNTISTFHSPEYGLRLNGRYSGQHASAYYDEVRITKGHARGYSGSTIAVPTSPFLVTMTLPGSPTGVTALGGNSQATVSWTAPADNGGSAITNYTIEYTPAGGSASTASVGSGATSFIVTGLTNGTSYTFKVRATNAVGGGAYSVASSAVTPNANLSGFTPVAVLLTSGTSYTIPTGATSMKAWAVSWGDSLRAGGVAYRTWAASGGTTVSYSLGGTDWWTSPSCEVTYGGHTISAKSEAPYFSGGDGGAEGGETITGDETNGYATYGGAVGGNSASLASCLRRPATEVSGLLAAVALAGGKAAEDCGTTAAFGSGGYHEKFGSNPPKSGGIGGSSGYNYDPGGPAVVLYFT